MKLSQLVGLLQAMISALTAEVKDVNDRVRALPRDLSIGDYFSGAGTCYRVIDTVFKRLSRTLPRATESLSVPS